PAPRTSRPRSGATRRSPRRRCTAPCPGGPCRRTPKAPRTPEAPKAPRTPEAPRAPGTRRAEVPDEPSLAGGLRPDRTRGRLRCRPLSDRRAPHRLQPDLAAVPAARVPAPPRAVRARRPLELGPGRAAGRLERRVHRAAVVRRAGLVRVPLRAGDAVERAAAARLAHPHHVRAVHGGRAVAAEPQSLHGRGRRQRAAPESRVPDVHAVPSGGVPGRPARPPSGGGPRARRARAGPSGTGADGGVRRAAA